MDLVSVPVLTNIASTLYAFVAHAFSVVLPPLPHGASHRLLAVRLDFATVQYKILARDEKGELFMEFHNFLDQHKAFTTEFFEQIFTLNGPKRFLFKLHRRAIFGLPGKVTISLLRSICQEIFVFSDWELADLVLEEVRSANLYDGPLFGDLAQIFWRAGRQPHVEALLGEIRSRGPINSAHLLSQVVTYTSALGPWLNFVASIPEIELSSNFACVSSVYLVGVDLDAAAQFYHILSAPHL